MTKKSALVSGASRGLGLAICRDLSQDHHVTGFARSQLVEASGLFKWDFVPHVDIASTETWGPITDALAEADVLVNNVGVAADGILATQAQEEIERVIHTNLTSTLLLTKSYIRLRLTQRKCGVIVNVGSIIGIRGYAGLVAYAASKAGLDAATRALAREMGPKGFRVNSILPGYFESDLSVSLNNRQREQIVRRTPLGRLASVDDVVPVVRFFASEEARFVTGQSLVVDGGITV